MSEPIGSIVIVGGGSAGWITATYLARMLRRQRVKITLVESPDIDTIGVGEATIPSMVRFVRAIGLDEGEFMRRVSASYKLAIRFTNWIEPGHEYWHPFGVAGQRLGGNDAFHYWLARKQAGLDVGPYAELAVQQHLAAAHRAPRPLDRSSPIIEQGTYAYHLDAGALALYLREIATGEGVTHLFGLVANVEMAPDGSIAAVDIGGGRRLTADLYIDCTGFRGVLAEREMKDPWIDWNHQLLNDRAVAMPVTRSDDVPPYTHATAMPDAGWVWQIALSSRTGMGYVYSSAHVDDDTATETLVAQAGLKRRRTADPRLLKMRIGHRTQFWNKNCIAIGLSGGFVEPIESTGLHATLRGVELLFEYLPTANTLPALRAAYNRRMTRLWDEIRDFVILHYYLNRRTEPFWRDARSVPLPSSFENMLALYDEFGQIEPIDGSVFADTNYYFILAGAGRHPRRAHPRTALAPPAELDRYFVDLKRQNTAITQSMPTHVELLDAIHAPQP